MSTPAELYAESASERTALWHRFVDERYADGYESTEERLFAAAVEAVAAYVESGACDLGTTLQAIAENLEDRS